MPENKNAEDIAGEKHIPILQEPLSPLPWRCGGEQGARYEEILDAEGQLVVGECGLCCSSDAGFAVEAANAHFELCARLREIRKRCSESDKEVAMLREELAEARAREATPRKQIGAERSLDPSGPESITDGPGPTAPAKPSRVREIADGPSEAEALAWVREARDAARSIDQALTDALDRGDASPLANEQEEARLRDAAGRAKHAISMAAAEAQWLQGEAAE